jgi:hypothetical protein
MMIGTTAEWFNTSAFQQLQPNGQPQRFGNEGRNVVEGPGFTQWDVAAIKNFRIRESKTLQFRAEFFNIFNQTNYRLPNNDINSRNFGKILGALDPRLIPSNSCSRARRASPLSNAGIASGFAVIFGLLSRGTSRPVDW